MFDISSCGYMWIHGVSQKARDHLVDKIIERLGRTPLP